MKGVSPDPEDVPLQALFKAEYDLRPDSNNE